MPMRFVAAVRRGNFDPAMLGQRLVVLRNLVALGQIGIKVVFAREDRALAHLAVERQRGQRGKLDGLLVQHGQRSGQPQANRANVGVRIRAEPVGATAKRLGRREQLHVHFEADHGLVFRQNVRRDGCGRHIGILSRGAQASCAIGWVAWLGRDCLQSKRTERRQIAAVPIRIRMETRRESKNFCKTMLLAAALAGLFAVASLQAQEPASPPETKVRLRKRLRRRPPRRPRKHRPRGIPTMRIGSITTGNCWWTLAGWRTSRRPMRCWVPRKPARTAWSSWATRLRRAGSWTRHFPASRM